MNLVDPVLTFYFTREDCSFGPGKNLRYGGMRPTPAMIASSALKMRYGSAVDVSAVTDIQDEHFPRFVVYLVDSRVIANADAPLFPTAQLTAPWRSRIFVQSENTGDDPLPVLFLNCVELLLGLAPDGDPVGHQSWRTLPSLISRTA